MVVPAVELAGFEPAKIQLQLKTIDDVYIFPLFVTSAIYFLVIKVINFSKSRTVLNFPFLITDLISSQVGCCIFSSLHFIFVISSSVDIEGKGYSKN